MERKSKMERNRKISRILPVFALTFALLAFSPITVKAEIRTGDCGANGDNVKYSYDTVSKKMTISGSGEMQDFNSSSYWGWSISALEIQTGVTSVGEYAFYDCDDLTSVTISNTVKSIGKGAFNSCDKLEEITLPSGVQSIGDDAFRSCYALEQIELPDTVNSIGERAVYYCDKLQSVKLPKNLKKIERETFSDCKSLTSVEIPDGVTSIGNYAFARCEKLTSVEIPGSVTSIGESAFEESGLTSVSISDGVQSIGFWAFQRCSDLTSVTIPDSVTSIGKGAFAGCSSLTNVEIPGSVTSIGAGAFGSTGLKNVTIPDSVRNIGDSAFLNCRDLKRVRIPKSVESIEDHAFGFNYSDSKYELNPDFVISCDQGSAAEAYVKKSGVKFEIKLSSLPPTGTDFTYNGSVRTGVQEEDYYTITDNTGVNAGTYTATVTLKGGYSWPDGKSSKKTVEWTIKPASISSAAVKVADQTYTGKPLTPQPTVKIADKTLIKNTDYTVSYSDNTNVGEATITITGRGNYTGTTTANFTIAEGKAPNPGSTDSSAAPVKTGDEIKDTKTKATYLITSTKTNNLMVTYVSPVSKTASALTVPDTVAIKGKNYKVTEIKANAFKNNKKLKKITIGKNIKKIGKNAFSGCKNLKTVTIKTTKLTKKTVGTNAFKNIHAKAKVKVPKSKLKSYKTILKARGIKGKNQKITK